jgi:dipeptidase E
MTLFLASEAKHPESIAKLTQFVGSFTNKRIAYIPTAANGAGYGSWKTGQSVQVARSLGAKLDIIELEDCVSTNVIDRIGQPDILWMAGGAAGYLLYWIRRCQLDKALPKILKQSIYVGSSAGSMICATTQNASDWYLGEPEPGANLLPGLGLIDFEIYPHYEDKLLPEIDQHWKKGKLYLLKNGEAITVVNGKVTVLGEERVLSK